ncbi:MAG TPA: acetate--CoA ligase family protein [Streptosporangiaceae bacterium]|nr:acetate--CoA ligase family protein [Streptosporangiaceae bacterium]
MAASSARQPTTATPSAADPSARRLLAVLLRRYGVPVVESVTADGADSAVEAAWWLGFPVTLVAEGARLAGRPEITRCGLATPSEVRMAYRRLTATLGSAMTGVRIRRQPQQGAEVVVRVIRKPGDDAQVSLVLGGPAGALVGARVTRSAPLGPRDAMDMLDELRGDQAAPARAGSCADAAPGVADQDDTTGHDGAVGPYSEPAPVAVAAGEPGTLDLAALAVLLERVSQLAARVPQVTELELNPVIVTRCGAAVAGIHGQFHRSEVAEKKQARLRRVS